LEPEEELLRNDSVDAALEGTAHKPTKTIGKIKVQGIVANVLLAPFHRYILIIALVTLIRTPLSSSS